jgi:DNA-directed RNA polymerase specialized sigma24 family protein
MNAEQHAEINRLSRHGYSIEQVANALTSLLVGEGDRKMQEHIIFHYYWPITLRKAFDFFKDEEEARNATTSFMEHWKVAMWSYKPMATLSAFYNRVVTNHFMDVQRKLDLGPEVLYGTETEDMGDDENAAESVVAYTEEYPFNGVDTNDPETIAIQRETEHDLGTRVNDIREKLYPGDKPVYDLLLENYTSDDVASILERSVVSVENAIRRIRETAKST